ncbi:MAG: glyoxalase/bleomycin resistance/dioxygenase family protein [Deinococcota bacterium]
MPQTTFPIAAVMIHVSDVDMGLEWYQQAFPTATKKTIVEADFDYLEYQGIMIELVQADEKVSSGAAGSVVYWWVDGFQEKLDTLLSLGATLYRGPITIEQGMKMCQVKDLWGNCIGIRGK